MNANNRYVWAIYFVGFDAPDSTPESANADDAVQPYVGRERIEVSDDPAQAREQLQLAAFLRGGQVLAAVADDQNRAEQTRMAIELQMLRYR